jgi:hypothetical protein
MHVKYRGRIRLQPGWTMAQFVFLVIPLFRSPVELVRLALRRQLDKQIVSTPEATMPVSVARRVGDWSQMTLLCTAAVIGPGKSAQSRATEAVLN